MTQRQKYYIFTYLVYNNNKKWLTQIILSVFMSYFCLGNTIYLQL